MENTKLKFTKKVEDKTFQGTITTYYINDIFIVRCRVYKAYFCTITNGAPSTIANKVKTAKEMIWNREGLIKLLGDKYNKENFINSGPDTRWGGTGYVVTMPKLKEIINELI